VREGGGEHAPWYVAHKDLARNTLHVVQGHGHAWLQSPWLEAEDLSWVAGHAPVPGALAAKTRYRQADAPCTLALHEGGFRLDFAAPQWAVTPGQSAVLYDGEVCLGGGVIARAAVPAVTATVTVAGPGSAPTSAARRRPVRKPVPSH
jgi:tRNA-specific 2-thiouridylase